MANATHLKHTHTLSKKWTQIKKHCWIKMTNCHHKQNYCLCDTQICNGKYKIYEIYLLWYKFFMHTYKTISRKISSIRVRKTAWGRIYDYNIQFSISTNNRNETEIEKRLLLLLLLSYCCTKTMLTILNKIISFHI